MGKLDHKKLEKYLSFCLNEEIDANYVQPIDGDLTTKAYSIQTSGTAFSFSEQCMVLCGLELIPMIQAFGAEDLDLFTAKDGDTIGTASIFLSVPGQTRQSPFGPTERTVLNFLQRLSGVAVTIFRGNHGSLRSLLSLILEKVGLRQLEKYATACGGGYNHRMGLHDRILIKDNHLAAASIVNSLRLASFLEGIRKRNPSEFIEVEWIA